MALPTWHSFGTLFTLFIGLYVGTRSYGTATSVDRGEGSFHWKAEWKANCKPARLFALIPHSSFSNPVLTWLPDSCLSLNHLTSFDARFAWRFGSSKKILPLVDLLFS